MNKVVIIGASGHGKVIAEILEQSTGYEILGFIDSFKKPGINILGYTVLGDELMLQDLCEEDPELRGIIAIGDNWNRKQIVIKLLKDIPKFKFISAIHPSAVVSSHSHIGEGVVIIAGTIVNPGAEIGNHCIINTKASVGHDSKMKDFSSLSPGVTLGGNVNIGELSTISMGSVVKNNVTIGSNTVVGSASYVHKDLPDNVVAYGNPARLIRTRNFGESYL